MPIDAANPVPPTYPRRAGMDQVPAHVPKDLIRSAGITFGPEFLKAPHAFMANLHDTMPPIWYDVGPMGNAWQFLKHEDALYALRHPEIFSNEGATPFPRDPDDYFYFIPQEIDPPEHRKYRNIVDPVFSPQGVLKLEGKIRKLANDLIDQFVARPVSASLPKSTDGHCRSWCSWTSWDCRRPCATPSSDGRWNCSIRTTARAWLGRNDRQDHRLSEGSAIADKKANPDDGVVSLIAHAAPGGVPLSDKEVFGFVCVPVHRRPRYGVRDDEQHVALSGGKSRQRCAEMIADPGNINAQVEELLRVWSVTFSGRVLIQDVEVRGVQLKKDDRVTCVLPACNFDPEVFPNPREVDFHRPKKPTLAFTVGVHSCMGAHLARLEMKIGLQEWLRRIPEFAVKPGTKIEYRPGGVVGPEAVPLVW